jgi:murein DD-endopeptidase MepM/ murein hydrolase activator NlpD
VAKGPLAGVRNWFNRLFPERQLYHRSHGQVRFVSMSAQTQIALLIVTLAFLGWVAYASVNVVFKEQIISAKERNLVAMQANYENRLAEAQSAYERLHQFLVQAEDRFQRETELLRMKQAHLETLVSHKEVLRRDLASLQTRLSIARPEDTAAPNSSHLLMQVTSLEPTPRVSRSSMPEMRTEGVKILGTIAALTVPRDGRPAPVSASTASTLSQLDAKIAGMRAAQRDMLLRFEEAVEHDTTLLEGILSLTNLPIQSLVRRASDTDAARGSGGPLISLDDMSEQLERDPGGEQFKRQMVHLTQKLERLTNLNESLARVPLVKPVDGLDISSGFGPRLDPFTRRVAFHSGTDFPGAYNMPVYATEDGVVSRAGRYSAYGRLVELDHGFGFKTRYGHLNQILVDIGDKVKFRQQVGKLGSTGRSTGPHIHYEVWYDGKVLDAERFFEAGRYVFEN